MQKCTNCGEDKAAGEFHRDRKRASGLGIWCKACSKIYKAAYYRDLSLDRIDRKGGYTADNVRLICHGINAFKGVGTDEEMLALAEVLLRQNRPDLFASPLSNVEAGALAGLLN